MATYCRHEMIKQAMFLTKIGSTQVIPGHNTLHTQQQGIWGKGK